MPAASNQSIVQSMYESFAKGDIPAVLARLADDIVWEGTPSPELPYSGIRRGKPAVLEFFAGVGQVDVSLFEPLEYFTSGNTIIALGRWAGNVRKTGKSFQTNWAMVWDFENGKVKRFRDYEDTAPTAAAFRK
jgi:uncharacterized protein